MRRKRTGVADYRFGARLYSEIAQPLEGSKEVDFQRYVALCQRIRAGRILVCCADALRPRSGRNGSIRKSCAGIFGKDQPLTAQGKFALARALLLDGERSEAQKLVREAWPDGNFSGALEAEMLDVFGNLITDADHKTRMDMRLYAEDVDGQPIAPAATRLSSYLAVRRGVPRFPTPGRPGAARNRAASRVVVGSVGDLGRGQRRSSEKLGGVEAWAKMEEVP